MPATETARRAGQVKLSGEVLLGMLQAPDGARLRDVRWDPYTGHVVLLVESEGMPAHEPGCLPAEVDVLGTRETHDCGHTTETFTWEPRS